MYTTIPTISNYLGIAIATSLNSYVTDLISAADSYIDKYTNRPEGFDNENVEKLYDGNGKTEIVIDHFTGTPTVVIRELDNDDTEFTLTKGIDNDFMTFPYNETVKYKLIMSVNSQVGNWSKGRQRISVTASFGNSSVPADIKLASTILAAKVLEKNVKGGEGVLRERLGDYSIDFGSEDPAAKEIKLSVKQILDRYKILELS